MLRFEACNAGEPSTDIDLSGAYMFGQDGIPVRADISVENGVVICDKCVKGASALALLWNAGDAGRFLLPTTRLAERDKPYNLVVELVRAQVARISRKREEWGIFDYADAQKLNDEFLGLLDKFISALKADTPVAAASIAAHALAEGLMLGEKFALFHADIFLNRRKALGQVGARTGFGCTVELASESPQYEDRLRDSFDFISLPMPWKLMEPKERNYDFDQTDRWINWAARSHKPLQAGPLLSFEPAHLPEWIYIWEHDYETLRDLIYEHIQRIVERYSRQVHTWNVVSGIHAHNIFNLSFEQLMEVTRMSCVLVKKLAPHSQVLIELTMPWGEYYARNQRTIPPLLYADMAVQSGIKFDGFGVQMCMGVPVDGYFVRDLMQISAVLDELVSFGKAIHITASQVPSGISGDGSNIWNGESALAGAGHWHAPWSQRLQAEWLQAFLRIAISKPFVESICWRDLADDHAQYIPNGGLCDRQLRPKLAYTELRNFRALLAANAPLVAPGDNTRTNR